ncbi:glutathione peroxidase [Xanthomonas cannabis]|uniref:glutathione peroxidase n=1 Tax=Xanthomonas TaxID=338 RepID=UPI0005758E26|nr:glutathione peroxidase [Xanthomonas cannabis]KHL57420.1 vitamin B12 ABC transporter permease [Xanthomonas cannabis pv. cannabis]KHL60080.1 vitamin B12 ABC transporter permease [Xanthomonas cannabis pv. cannabis]MCC8442605.1 glutathione peroxidase [Xanthomonas cannabis]
MLLKRLLVVVFAGFFAGSALAAGAALLDLDYRPLAGKAPINLNRSYGGKVVMVVNTASKCGYTPQYEGLEALNKRYASRGFAVLGFPSNDFQGQEPGSEKQIQEFCTLTYGVKFPMFEKVHVLGKEATPLYQRLTQATGVAPGWNFHKYLIGRDGRVVAQFPSKIKPDDPRVVSAIERELNAPSR